MNGRSKDDGRLASRHVPLFQPLSITQRSQGLILGDTFQSYAMVSFLSLRGYLKYLNLKTMQQLLPLRPWASSPSLPSLEALLLVDFLPPKRRIANPQKAHDALVHHRQNHIPVSVSQPHVQHPIHLLAARRI